MQSTLDAVLAVEDETQRYQLGVALFGTMWEDLGQDAITALMDTEGGILATNEAMSQVKTDAYDNLATSITTLGRTLKAELLQPIVDLIAPAIKGVVDWMIENMNIVKPIIIGVATAFGVLASALAISGIISTVQKAMVLLNSTLLANPIALVVAAIGGLVAAFVTAYQNSETFRNIVNAAMAAVWAVVEPIAESIKNALIQAWQLAQAVWALCEPYFTTIWNNLKIGVELLKTTLANAFQTAWSIIQITWSVVSGYFQTVWNTIAAIFSVVKSVLSGDFSGAWEAIKGIVSGWAGYFGTVWESIKKVFAAVVAFFRLTFNNAWEAVKGVFSNWSTFFGNLWTTIKDKFSSIGTNIADAISGAVKTGINGVLSKIESTINKAIGIINSAIDMINKIPGVDVGKVSTVSFPRLARGGVVYEPTLAEIGEYAGASRNPEIVTPQNILRDTFEESLAKFALNQAGASDSTSRSDTQYLATQIGELRTLIAEYLPEIASKAAKNIYLDKRRLIGELAADMDEALGDIANRRAVGAV
jgi:phage-related protein